MDAKFDLQYIMDGNGNYYRLDAKDQLVVAGYDKASWHIDAGENEKDVIHRFEVLFDFLLTKNFLNDDGKETMEYGMDSSISLNNTMLTDDGIRFLNKYFDEIISKSPKNLNKL